MGVARGARQLGVPAAGVRGGRRPARPPARRGGAAARARQRGQGRRRGRGRRPRGGSVRRRARRLPHRRRRMGPARPARGRGARRARGGRGGARLARLSLHAARPGGGGRRRRAHRTPLHGALAPHAPGDRGLLARRRGGALRGRAPPRRPRRPPRPGGDARPEHDGELQLPLDRPRARPPRARRPPRGPRDRAAARHADALRLRHRGEGLRLPRRAGGARPPGRPRGRAPPGRRLSGARRPDPGRAPARAWGARRGARAALHRGVRGARGPGPRPCIAAAPWSGGASSSAAGHRSRTR